MKPKQPPALLHYQRPAQPVGLPASWPFPTNPLKVAPMPAEEARW